MKRILFIVLFLSSTIGEVVSQNHIRLSQFFQTPQFYNPGFTGIEPFTDIKVGRKQSLGAFEYAPKTSFISFNSSFNGSQANKAESYSLRISNPQIYKDLKRSSISIFKHGLGAFYVNENQEAFTQQRLQFSYALHLALGEKTRLSLGVSPYLFNNRVDLDKITFEVNPDPFYSQYDQVSFSHIGANAGLLLYSKYLYIGYSSIDIFKTKPTFSEGISSDSTGSKNQISHRLMGGFIMNFGKRLELIPSIVMTINGAHPLFYNMNAKFRYDKRYWAGFSYQTSGTMSIVAGGVINHWLNVGYSYDHTFRGVSNYTSGSHEIIIGIMLFNNNLNKPYFW